MSWVKSEQSIIVDIVYLIFNSIGSYCGVFRRQALEKGAIDMGANKICTGHNGDDVAETVLMNGDLFLKRILFDFYKN